MRAYEIISDISLGGILHKKKLVGFVFIRDGNEVKKVTLVKYLLIKDGSTIYTCYADEYKFDRPILWTYGEIVNDMINVGYSSSPIYSRNNYQVREIPLN
jgi:hypothetical protein